MFVLQNYLHYFKNVNFINFYYYNSNDNANTLKCDTLYANDMK